MVSLSGRSFYLASAAPVRTPAFQGLNDQGTLDRGLKGSHGWEPVIMRGLLDQDPSLAKIWANYGLTLPASLPITFGIRRNNKGQKYLWFVIRKILVINGKPNDFHGAFPMNKDGTISVVGNSISPSDYKILLAELMADKGTSSKDMILDANNRKLKPSINP